MATTLLMSLSPHDREVSHFMARSARESSIHGTGEVATLTKLSTWCAVTWALRCTKPARRSAAADRDLAKRFALIEPAAYGKTLKQFVFPNEVGLSIAAAPQVPYPRHCMLIMAMIWCARQS